MVTRKNSWALELILLILISLKIEHISFNLMFKYSHVFVFEKYFCVRWTNWTALGGTSNTENSALYELFLYIWNETQPQKEGKKMSKHSFCQCTIGVNQFVLTTWSKFVFMSFLECVVLGVINF